MISIRFPVISIVAVLAPGTGAIHRLATGPGRGRRAILAALAGRLVLERA